MACVARALRSSLKQRVGRYLALRRTRVRSTASEREDMSRETRNRALARRSGSRHQQRFP